MDKNSKAYREQLKMEVFGPDLDELIFMVSKPNKSTSTLVFTTIEVPWLALNLQNILENPGINRRWLRRFGADRDVALTREASLIRMSDLVGNWFRIDDEQARKIVRKLERALGHGIFDQTPERED